MFLLTVLHKECLVEASLGGRVTHEEVKVLTEELADTFDDFGGHAFNLLLDYSKAKTLDRESTAALGKLKDFCLANGAVRIVSVVQDEHELVRHTTDRLQAVMQGQEEFVTEP